VLHRVEWHRLIIDDGHGLVKGAVATRQSRLEALHALRITQKRASWLLIESSRVPKLRQTRSEMRGLMTAIRASPDESLVDLVPRRMKFID